MLRRLVSLAALAALTLSFPAFAATGKSSAKPATKSSTASKKRKAKTTKKKPVAKPAATATPAPVAATPVHKADPDGRTFIRTQRAGWQEVVVGETVVATRADGSKVTGTIREVSDFAIVIEPKTAQQVTIASSDLNQVFASR